MQGIVFNIQHFSVHDGPGIRSTVFLKGCPLACWWCHNPEGRCSGIEVMNGKTIGWETDPDTLMQELLSDRLFYDQSGGGVTFSGGEPLAQPDFLEEMLVRCRAEGIHTVVDTSGYAPAEVFNRISPLADLFLFDLKFIDPEAHAKYTQVTNETILRNLENLVQAKRELIVRIPLIPRITDTAENLDQILRYLMKLNYRPEINLLPFHRTGVSKYQRYELPYRLNGTRELQPETYQEHLKSFASAGFRVKLGG